MVLEVSGSRASSVVVVVAVAAEEVEGLAGVAGFPTSPSWYFGGTVLRVCSRVALSI